MSYPTVDITPTNGPQARITLDMRGLAYLTRLVGCVNYPMVSAIKAEGDQSHDVEADKQISSDLYSVLRDACERHNVGRHRRGDGAPAVVSVERSWPITYVDAHGTERKLNMTSAAQGALAALVVEVQTLKNALASATAARDNAITQRDTYYKRLQERNESAFPITLQDHTGKSVSLVDGPDVVRYVGTLQTVVNENRRLSARVDTLERELRDSENTRIKQGSAVLEHVQTIANLREKNGNQTKTIERLLAGIADMKTHAADIVHIHDELAYHAPPLRPHADKGADSYYNPES